jgi:hypothetical protein
MILVDDETNRSMFNNIAMFFKDGVPSGLSNCVRAIFSMSEAQRDDLSRRTREYARHRYSPDIFRDKMLLAMRAAKTYRTTSDPSALARMKAEVESTFDKDLDLFGYHP